MASHSARNVHYWERENLSITAQVAHHPLLQQNAAPSLPHTRHHT